MVPNTLARRGPLGAAVLRYCGLKSIPGAGITTVQRWRKGRVLSVLQLLENCTQISIFHILWAARLVCVGLRL